MAKRKKDQPTTPEFVVPPYWQVCQLPNGATFQDRTDPSIRGVLLSKSFGFADVHWPTMDEGNWISVAPAMEVLWIAGKSRNRVVVNGAIHALKDGVNMKQAIETLKSRGYEMVFPF